MIFRSRLYKVSCTSEVAAIAWVRERREFLFSHPTQLETIETKTGGRLIVIHIS
jgi:hypothetical protein